MLAAGLMAVAAAGAIQAALGAAARVHFRTLLEDDGVGGVQRRLVDQPLWTWSGLVVLESLALIACGLGLAWITHGAPWPVAAALAAAGVLVVIGGAVVLPRRAAGRRPEAAVNAVGPLVAGLIVGVRPLAKAVEIAWQKDRPAGAPEAQDLFAPAWGDEEWILQASGEDEGGLEEGEREMIAGIFELGETKVREVMVPRIDIVAIPADSTLDAALATIIAAGHSRIPVYRESIDDIAGLLYAKDLLQAYRDRDFEPDLNERVREAYFVPESKAVDELLAELRSRKVHMAIVVDEYGGTAGLVTIEDLLEEIVGEIVDEYDVEETRIDLVSTHEGVFHAGVDIDDVNRLMGIHLPTGDVDTLAGLVFTRLGKVPAVGEEATFDDAVIQVLELAGRRIRRVRVVRTVAAEAPAEI